MPRASSPPRRSARAKPYIPPPSLPPPPTQSGSSSANSSLSARNDRNIRSINKHSSPQKSTTPTSHDPEDVAPYSQGPLQTRRSGRRNPDDMKRFNLDNSREIMDQIDEDDEVTRCVCGFVEYPGPPAESLPVRNPKSGRRNSTDPEADREEIGSLFIQCDTCKVWQHGGCVGIMNEETSPDSYFCESCRPDLHRLAKSVNSQKYSKYLPVTSKNPKLIYAKPPNVSLKESEKSAKASLETTKRRSTMNSRAAYDEDEMLRKVLEESKAENKTLPSEANSLKKGKRARDDSDDQKSDAKRQRTTSDHASSSLSRHGSNDDATDNGEDKKKQVPRGAAAKSQRDKEIKEKEKERADAATKRKGRAERRRVDDNEMGEDGEENGTTVPSIEDNITPAPDNLVTKTKTSNKRGKGNRNAKETSTSPGLGSGGDSTGTTTANLANPASRRGRANNHDTNGHSVREPTMAELKRKANAMLQYISQAQINMANVESRGIVREKTGDKPDAAALAAELATRLVKWQQDFTMDGTQTVSGEADTASAKSS